MPVTGDWGGLRDLLLRVAWLGDGTQLTKLSRELAEEARTQAIDGFKAERDPYGKAWAPLKRRQGAILRDTGRLSNSYSVRRVGALGFVLGSNTKYGLVHQTGADYVAGERYAAVGARGRFARAAGNSARARRKPGTWNSRIASHRIVIPARPMVPTQARGLGPIWGKAFREVTTTFLSRLLKR